MGEARACERLPAGIQEPYDALVVDEAQDFDSDWLMALQFLLNNSSDAPITLFLDDHQQIFDRRFARPADWPELTLDQNCRNTRPIATKVAAIFGDPAPSSGAEGRDLGFVEATSKNLCSIVQDVVERLVLDEQIDPAEVAVLFDSREGATQMRTRLAASRPFGSLEEAGIVAETVHRFKGLETGVLVLALSDALLSAGDRLAPLLYVGMSRARSALILVGSKRVLLDRRGATTKCSSDSAV